MRKLILIIATFLILFSAVGYCDEEVYAIEKKDGTVSVIFYDPSSGKSLTKILKENGIDYKKIVAKKRDEIPPFEDSKFWKVQGNDLNVDEAEKNEQMALEIEKENSKIAVLEKLKISEEELKAITK